MFGEVKERTRKKGKVVTVNGKRIVVKPSASKVTHLTDRSASRMSRNVRKMNEKVLQFINNQ